MRAMSTNFKASIALVNNSRKNAVALLFTLELKKSKNNGNLFSYSQISKPLVSGGLIDHIISRCD